MIARLFLFVLLLAVSAGRVLALDVWFNSVPASAQSGEGYYVEVACQSYSDPPYCDLILYKNGQFLAYEDNYPEDWYSGVTLTGAYVTDYGAQTVEYSAQGYDWTSGEFAYAYAWVTITVPNSPPTIDWSSAPGSAPVNESFYIEAHGSDSDGNLAQVNVWREWTPYAFAGGGDGYNGWSGNPTTEGSLGAVTFMAQAVDGNGLTSDIIYHTINIYQPNRSPAIAWNIAPGSAYVNQWFTMQAVGTDPDGNLALVYVWKDGQPFAFNGGGDGYTGYSDNNAAVSAYPGAIQFDAIAIDGNNENSGYITHYVTIVNRAPDSPTVSSGGVTTINLGQAVTISGTLHDPDGNLASHHLYYQPPGGSGWTDLVGGAPADGTNSSLSTSYTPNAVGAWWFHSNGHDGYLWGPGATVSVNVVDGTAPSVPGGLSASANTTGTSFTLNWSACTDNVTAPAALVYEVMRDTTSLGQTAAGVTSLPVTGLAQGATYGMKVRARDAAGLWSAWSTVLNVTTPDVTAPSVPVPANFSVSANTTGSSFTLNWVACTDNLTAPAALVYEVMRDTTSLGQTAAGVTSKPVTGLAQGATYGMKVRARDAAGLWSAWSTPAYNVTTPDVTAPSVPTGLAAPAPGNTSFMLTWNASTDNLTPQGSLQYEVMRDTTNLSAAAGASRNITQLSLATTYAMKVRARDAAGNLSGWSTVLNVTTTAVPNVDSDGDGASDVLELQLGTDPNVAQTADNANSTQLTVHKPN